MTVINTLRIFLVDDNIFYKAIFQQLMNSLEYSHVFFYSCIEEMLNANTEEADVIFLDYGLDAAKGIECLKKLKQKNPHIYIVFISASDNTTVIESSVQFGAFDYIIKGKNDAEKITKVLVKIQQIQNILNNNRHKFY